MYFKNITVAIVVLNAHIYRLDLSSTYAALVSFYDLNQFMTTQNIQDIASNKRQYSNTQHKLQ
jgi:hypothetical protein